jgi:hypothetical protein
MLYVCYGLRFLLRRVPQDVIHPRSSFAPVGRHSLDGHGTAAPRADENVLQGTDLAPLPLLFCLHDTDLQTTHVPVDSSPVDLVPVPPVTQARASS